MPWISVHDSINGSKLRKLFKALNCSKFEATGILVFLWFWGLNNADKTGKIPFVDSEDIVRELYGVGTGCHLDIEKVVQALFDTGWIDKEEDGSFRLHDWDVWQAQWYKAIDRREKDVERKARARNEKNTAKKESQTSESGSLGKEQDFPKEIPAENPEENPQSTAKTPNGGFSGDLPKKKAAGTYKPTFEEFWNAYPKKEGKAEAYKKYNARLKDGWSEIDLLRAAKNYAYVVNRQRTEMQYIKHAKTFLSENTPFTDFLPKKKEADPQTSSGANPFAEYKDE